MNIVSKLKNIKHGIFALITNGIVDVLSNFKKYPITGLASIAINASMLPSIYYFYKLIKARQEGSKRVFKNEMYDNVGELVEASPYTEDPRKEKGVVAGKVSIYRLTCVIGSIISLAFSILSLYSFISSLRFKNQMNAWGISFALLSPLVAAVTIFLQGKLVSRNRAVLNKRIGIARLRTTRDVHHYYESEPMKVDKKRKTHLGSEARTITIEKPYYASFVCALSLSFAAFAQSIAVYKLPNTMRISAFVVCANLCFALSKLIFDAYYAYQCNIYDEKNRVVVMGETIQESDDESSDERSLLHIRLAGKVGELRGALNTKLNGIMGLIQKSIEDRPEEIHTRGQLVVKAALLRLALDSLEKPVYLELGGIITNNENIAMNIVPANDFTFNQGNRAIYSTGFNGSDPAVLKAECEDLTQPLKKEAYIHGFKGGKVKMDDQHLCYGMEEAESLLNGEIDFCKVHINIGPELTQKATITLLELVALVLAAKNPGIASSSVAISKIEKAFQDIDAIDAIETAIKKVTTEAEVVVTTEAGEVVAANPNNLKIAPERLLQQLKNVESAFDFEVAIVGA